VGASRAARASSMLLTPLPPVVERYPVPWRGGVSLAFQGRFLDFSLRVRTEDPRSDELRSTTGRAGVAGREQSSAHSGARLDLSAASF
jgi:hypothetical protein